MAQNLEALGRGEIDVAQMFEPIGDGGTAGDRRDRACGSARGLTRIRRCWRPGPPSSGWEASSGERSAIGRTLAWLVGHSAAELAEVVAAYFPDVAREDLVAAFHRYREAGLWSSDTGVTREGFQRLAVSLQSGGFIARAARLRRLRGRRLAGLL